MKTTRLITVTFLCLMICSAGGTPCRDELLIYQTPYFKAGQQFSLIIDNQVVVSKKFDKEFHSNDFRKLKNYCLKKDSSTVKFTLDGKDTIFFISLKRTKRLLVGSDINGNFSIATDEDKRAWIKM